MTTRWTPRRIAAGVGRRARKLVEAPEPTEEPKPLPAVSVIVPIYNVEQYLPECLDSIVEQQFVDFEVVVVDDGSPDKSADIAADYASRDERITVVARPNGGLGAARNTGMEHARGEFLTFVDSDDVLPPDALKVLVRSARMTGSDMVVGSVRRFNASDTWKPGWVDDLQSHRREAITIDDFPELVRNNYTWCKLYRRRFWQDCGFSFREGVSYEDQPVITRLYIAAAKIDVIPEVVYRYRAREDASSISQQTATVPDLLDRIAAWHESQRVFAKEASQRVYDAWLQTLFDAHFHWYLRSPGTVDDTYWTALRKSITELTADAPQHVWDATLPQRRITIELARRNRRADVQEFTRQGGHRVGSYPATVTTTGVRLDLPFHDDPGLDDRLFELRPEQLQLSHAVQRFHWDDGSTMNVAGWAYIRHVDLTGRSNHPELILRNERTGDEHAFESSSAQYPGFAPPDEDDWVDYSAGAFWFTVPMEDVVGANHVDNDAWSVHLRVTAAGFTVESAVTRVKRSSSAGVVHAGELSNGDLLTVDWHLHAPLRLVLDRLRVEAVDLDLNGRTLRGSIAGPEADNVRQLHVISDDGGDLVSAGLSGRRFEVEVPSQHAVANMPPGAAVRTRVEAELASGERVATSRRSSGQFERVQDSPHGALGVECTRVGELGLVEWRIAAYARTVSVSPHGVARITGEVYGAPSDSLVVKVRSKKTDVRSAPATIEGTSFSAAVPLRYTAYRFGEVPLPALHHDMYCLVGDGDEATEVPLQVSRELSDSLPVAVSTSRLEGRVIRGARNRVRVALNRPLGDAAGRCRQFRLRAANGRQFATDDRSGLLVRSYFGETATDSGIGLQKELQRRGADIDVYWAVQDHSVPVPDGGIPVIINSLEWYRRLNSAKYYLDNMYQPKYHRKPSGQVIIQTFHGYPFKTMGHPHWEQSQFSQQLIASYDERAAEWDYLVSPASYATPLLARDFEYGGEMLEIGYPRNDVLFGEAASSIREQARRSLGIAEHQTAVLYAPTFRDYLSSDDTRAAMVDFLDLDEVATTLGDDYVILVRGHAFNARTPERIRSHDNIVDVTDYPRVADLHLAADAAVVDYSSLRFDFGVTGKPMVFHVPDLEHYKQTRGWLFDFEPTAPGPLVSTTKEVVDALGDLRGVAKQYRAAYETFRHAYLDLEDGNASARLVDAVFVPRGDAPPR